MKLCSFQPHLKPIRGRDAFLQLRKQHRASDALLPCVVTEAVDAHPAGNAAYVGWKMVWEVGRDTVPNRQQHIVAAFVNVCHVSQQLPENGSVKRIILPLRVLQTQFIPGIEQVNDLVIFHFSSPFLFGQRSFHLSYSTFFAAYYKNPLKIRGLLKNI
jgi:hypothetical protein